MNQKNHLPKSNYEHNREITSLSNEKLKKVKSYYIKKYRERYSKAVVEGVNSVEALVTKFPNLVDEIIVNQEIFSKENSLLSKWDQRILRIIETANNINIYQTNSKTLNSITANSEGVLAVCQTKVDNSIKDIADMVLVCKETSDPGNAGTIIRNAVAFGVSQVIFTGKHVDHWNPKLIRASVGSVFQIAIQSIVDIQTAVDYLRMSGYKILMTDGYGIETKPAIGLKSFKEDKCLVENKPIALFFGNEAHGLSDDDLKFADYVVKIETTPNGVESLNLASSVAICLYELNSKYI